MTHSRESRKKKKNMRVNQTDEQTKELSRFIFSGASQRLIPCNTKCRKRHEVSILPRATPDVGAPRTPGTHHPASEAHNQASVNTEALVIQEYLDGAAE